MARAGFTAIHSGRIRFGKDGRWYCDDEPIPNRAICRLYAKAMTIDADGSYSVYVPATRYRGPMSFVLIYYAAVALARVPTALPGAA